MGDERSGSGGEDGIRREDGQATAEWLGLVLVVALALGALAAFRAPATDRRLGELVAERIGSSLDTAGASRAAAAGGGSRAGIGPEVPRPTAPPGGTAALLSGAGRPRAPDADVAARDGGASRVAGRARLVDAFRRLRTAGPALARRAWIVCLGYRRFRYELEHPRAPNEAMPLDEAVDIANGCLNPYSFLTVE
jgi:hypothetical protein